MERDSRNSGGFSNYGCCANGKYHQNKPDGWNKNKSLRVIGLMEALELPLVVKEDMYHLRESSKERRSETFADDTTVILKRSEIYLRTEERTSTAFTNSVASSVTLIN